MIEDARTVKAVLVMKGGGVKGLAFAGAIQQLERFYEFHTFVGTSAGAIGAALLAAGTNAADLEHNLREKRFRDFLDGSYWTLPFVFWWSRGIHPAHTLIDWVRDLLFERLDRRNEVLMHDLPKRAVVYASTQRRGEVTFDSWGQHDDITVYNAVRCSMSIPYFFQPQWMDNRRVYDGGLLANFPVQVFLNQERERTNGAPDPFFIALYLGSEKPPPIKPTSVLADLLGILIERNDPDLLQKYRDQTVLIDTDPIGTIDFDLDDAEKDFLVLQGQVAALKFLAVKKLLKEEELTNLAQLQSKAKAVKAAIVERRQRRNQRRNRSIWSIPVSVAALAMAWVGLSFFKEKGNFQSLGVVEGFATSGVHKISTDGKVVVGGIGGREIVANNYPVGAMRWSAEKGMVYIGPPRGRSEVTEALGVNVDGSIVVGYVGYGGNCSPNEPWRWTAAEGMVRLPVSGSSMAFDVNANGTVIVGSLTPCMNKQAGKNQAAIYTEATGWTALGFLPGNDSSGAFGVSKNGQVVVGQSCLENCEAFRWTQQTGMVGLGVLPGTSSSQASRVSGDGTVTVGSSRYANGNTQAFRWTAADRMEGLGYLPGASSSSATHVNEDGSVVVGTSGGRAFRWTVSGRMQSIEELLTAAGVSFTGWKLVGADGVSGDGTVIAGTGINPQGVTAAWIATLPRPK
nr:patatin-like phospholipase family protein [Bradyrhizobium diazoefficiens]